MALEEPDNPLEEIFRRFAERHCNAPGAARLARLAKTAKRIPEPVIAELAALVMQLDDVPLVGDDFALHLIEVGFCDVRYSDATAFASALTARLHRYAADPVWAGRSRGDLRKQVQWWCMALGGRLH